MTADTNFSAAERIGMFKLSWPYVKSVLATHWRLIALLIVISVLLGFVPTVKSELEAGLINQISDTIRDRTIPNPAGSPDSSLPAASPPESFSEAVADVLSVRIRRFETVRTDEGIPEEIARVLFGRVGIGLALLIYLVLSVAAYSVDFLTTILQTRISREVFARLRSVGLTKGLGADPAHLPALSNVAGQYSNAIQIGAANVGNTYGYLLDAGRYLLSLGTALFLVCTKSPQFAVACLVVVLLQAWLSYIQGRRLRSQRNQLDTSRNELLARTDDVLSKREIILAYERQPHYGRKLEEYTRAYAEVVRTLEIKEKFFSLMSRLVMDYGRMVILVVGLLVTLGIARRSSQVSDIGDAYFFLSIYGRILVPAIDLLQKYNSIKQSESTSRTFLAVLRPQTAAASVANRVQASGDDETRTRPLPVGESANAVIFENVYFKYVRKSEPEDEAKRKEQKWILNGISFNIPARKTTLILGRSGCGKTTIARILLGFWKPDQGEVTVCGRPLSEYEGEALRELMAYVSQGDHIIDETVAENLSWGHTKDGREISRETMLATLAQLKVTRNDEEAKVVLDRFARDLSGGEQQRLSFARMMLDESEIVILDEPFAGVDIFTIREIRPHLSRIFDSSEHTVIMFSHRLAFASFADHVVIFGNQGTIIEQGPPGELINRNGEFAKLYAEARLELNLSAQQSPN